MYIIAFLIACLFSISISGVIIFVTHRVRRAHCGTLCATSCVSRLGGVAMICAFFAALILHPDLVIDRAWIVLFIALGAVAFLGIWDDVSPLSWRPQLFAQVAIGLFLFALSIRITYVSHPFGGVVHFVHGDGFPWMSLIITLVWFVAIMNTMNWLDGVDGLGGGVALIAAGTIFVTALLPHVNQPPIAIVAAAMAGATVGFLFWNWFPACIIAGTSGSFFWGLLIAVLAIFAGAKIATTLLVMIIPLVDAVWVIGERFFAGESIFASDKRHIHYKLAARGWAPWQIASLFIVVTAVVAFNAIHFYALGKMITIGIVIVLMLFFLAILSIDKDKKIKEKNAS